MIVGLRYSAFDNMIDQIHAQSFRKVNPGTIAQFHLPSCFAEDAHDRDLYICEKIFEATNLQEGPIWKRIEPNLPQTRTHTSLSVGDEVFIEDRLYLCKSFGWERIF